MLVITYSSVPVGRIMVVGVVPGHFFEHVVCQVCQARFALDELFESLEYTGKWSFWTSFNMADESRKPCFDGSGIFGEPTSTRRNRWNHTQGCRFRVESRREAESSLEIYTLQLNDRLAVDTHLAGDASWSHCKPDDHIGVLLL